MWLTYPAIILLMASGFPRGLLCERAKRQVAIGRAGPGNEGCNCINVRQCPQLLDMLRNQRQQAEAAQILRSLRCGTTQGEPLVCCPGVQPRNRPSDRSTLLSPPTCGTSGNMDVLKIVGGSPAQLGSWPWIAALGYKTDTNPKLQWLCAGSLINERYILTAAHCIDPPSYKLTAVRLGELDLNSTEDGATPVDVGIERAIPHVSFTSTRKNDDIALLKLKEPVKFTSHIQPICLPKGEYYKTHTFEKLSPFVAGWGSVSYKGPLSSQLMEIQIPVVSNERCKKAYNKTSAVITPKQLCVGFDAGGRDPCRGDSGGPLMLPNKTSFYQIGVVSYGYKCAEAGYPGIYTRVTEYIDWITENMI